MVTFDEAGKIAAWDDRSGPVATTPEAIAVLGEVIGDAALQAAEPVKAIYESLLETPLIQDLLIVIGKTRYALNGSVDDLRTRETNLGRLVSDSYLWQARRVAAERGMERRIDLALKNSGGIRDSVLSQEITKFLVGSTLPYDNELAILELSGRELLAALENGVAYAPSRSGGFPQVAGLRVEYDPRRPGVPRAASRDEPSRVVDLDILGDNGEVTSLVRNSRVVGDLSQTFLAVVNGFLLYGGDSYVAFDVARMQPGRVVIEIGVGEREALIAYIQEGLNGEIDLPDDLADPRIKAFNELGNFASYETGEFDESAAEMIAYDAGYRRLFVSNGDIAGIDVLDLTDLSNPKQFVSWEDLDGEVAGVAAANGIVAVALADNEPLEAGHVVLLSAAEGIELNRLRVGVQPAMIVFSPDGRRVLTANEGEPNDDYTVDPKGSVSLIDLGAGTPAAIGNLGPDQVVTVDFTTFDGQAEAWRQRGVRLFGRIQDPATGDFMRWASLSEDLEPESVAVSPDGTRAYVRYRKTTPWR